MSQHIHGTGFILDSFTDCEGSCVIAGKTWRWEFSALFGPLFVTAQGEPLKNQPGPRHPVWKRFEEWHNELRAEQVVMRHAGSASEGRT